MTELRDLLAPIQLHQALEACRRVARDGAPQERRGRSTYVLFEGQRLPAKYVLGLAYEIATGQTLSPERYHGGAATARILRRLGLTVIQVVPATGMAPQRTSAFLRIATASIRGTCARAAGDNRERIDLLHRIVEGVIERGWKPAALLLPGGFFYGGRHVGPEADADRKRLLENQVFSSRCSREGARLGAAIVAGVDTREWQRRGYADPDPGDQLCVAWGAHGIVGVGRKIFPAPGEANSYTVYTADFSSAGRLTSIQGRAKGLLCSCYDMFGTDETADAMGTRSKSITWLAEGRKELWEKGADRAEMKSRVRRALPGWSKMVQRATVGLVAIHSFTAKGPGSGKGYWQKHGIEKASRVIGGRVAFGAAHFKPRLPAADRVILAAAKGRALAASDYFYLDGRRDPDALVRFFDTTSHGRGPQRPDKRRAPRNPLEPGNLLISRRGGESLH